MLWQNTDAANENRNEKKRYAKYGNFLKYNLTKYLARTSVLFQTLFLPLKLMLHMCMIHTNILNFTRNWVYYNILFFSVSLLHNIWLDIHNSTPFINTRQCVLFTVQVFWRSFKFINNTQNVLHIADFNSLKIVYNQSNENNQNYRKIVLNVILTRGSN